ncbi:efflux RND transporter permease subunit [Arenicella sp. 4NH20-0111]|uniref:efflux RND transporter permease subunit n=1 Tax=Arenicella sp. 4NH20-0111 TaxID=3127648 RepID=UPI00310804D8
MNLAELSIKNNRITLFLLVVSLLAGISAYDSLSRDSMPPFTVKVATIVSNFPGASPERVELLVTDKIEKKAQELPELKEVSSTSRTGLSVVTVQLKDEVQAHELQGIWDRLRRKVENVEGLPQGVEPELNDDDIGVTYGIAIALTSDGFSYVEMKEYADQIRDDLIKLDEAAKVELNGEQEERIYIEFDDSRLAEYGLTASKLQGILGSLNILSSGGQINLLDERINLEPTGNFTTVEDIRDTLIPVGDGGQTVYLGDITGVRKGYADPYKQVVRVNGNKALTLHVSLKDGANVIKLGQEINLLVKDWVSKLPIGLELQRVVSIDSYIDKKVDDFVVNLMQSISIILLVMLAFLGFRTGLVIASLIPIVTILTLLQMNIFGLGLNQVTLAALIMALGMMVDNAIVVAEMIQVKMEEGVDRKRAASEAFSELWMSLLISTLTSSIAFLAFYLAESDMGDIVGPIFLVITFALATSWLVAMSIITLLCYYFLRVSSSKEKKIGLVDQIIYSMSGGYQALILNALSRKALVIGGSLALLFLALFGFRYVEFLFFPDSDRNLVAININLPLGTRIETTEEVVDEISEFISETLIVNDSRVHGVTSWSSYIGEGPSSYDLGYSADEANSSYAHILVNTSSFEQNNMIIDTLDEFSTSHIPQADILVNTLAAGGTGTPIEIKVSGDQPDQLALISEQIRLKLISIAGTKNVKDDWGPKSKKFIIEIDQARAQSAGVTSTDIATSLQTSLDGVDTGEYREGDKTIPILLKSNLRQQSLQSLQSMSVFAQASGASVPLQQVAKIVPAWQYAKIKRSDLSRTLTVSSELTPTGNASQIMSVVEPWLMEQQLNWPSGYSYSTGGDAENSAESMGAVVKWLPLSGIIIVLLLVFQFNSFRQTFMVVVTIPLGLIGVTFGLLVFQKPFGFMPFLGLISLAGIVINNAIVLLDRIEFENSTLGHSIQESIVHACVQRFRPILLATFTTVLGLLPLYLSGGALWEGMAISIMCGLMFGTIITLVLIPCLYSLLYRVDFKDFDPNRLSV